MRQLLDEAISDYLSFRASQDLAKNTLLNERGALKLLLQVNGNIWVHKIDAAHVTRYFEEATKTRQASSQGPLYTALHGFFKWARHTKRMDIDNDPMFGRRKPKRIKRERDRVHVSKFPALLDVAEERCDRDRALVACLLYTLLRSSELADVRIRDLDLDAGYMIARISKSHLEDRVPISSELDAELRKWLTTYTQAVGPLKPHYYLIPRRLHVGIPHPVTGKFTSPHEARYAPEQKAGIHAQLIHPVLEGVGFDTSRPGEGCHTLRRSGARALFDALSEAHHPRPLRVVKDMLHHASESITEVYLGIQADRLDRDAVIRGKSMYGLQGGTVVPFSRAQ